MFRKVRSPVFDEEYEVFQGNILETKCPIDGTPIVNMPRTHPSGRTYNYCHACGAEYSLTSTQRRNFGEQIAKEAKDHVEYKKRELQSLQETKERMNKIEKVLSAAKKVGILK